MNLNCPKCGGPAYDNRDDPNRKPNQPLAKCKNKQGCGWATWKPEDLPAAAPAPSGPANPNQPTRRKPVVLDKLLAACVGKAIEISGKYPPDGAGQGVDHDILTRLTGMLFIARVDGKGVLESEIAALIEAKKKADEERRQREEEERKRKEEEAARAAAQAKAHGSGPHDWPPLGDPLLGEEDLPF